MVHTQQRMSTDLSRRVVLVRKIADYCGRPDPIPLVLLVVIQYMEAVGGARLNLEAWTSN